MTAKPVRLGPLQLDRPIGVGGAGEVWQGVHVASSVPVAVKVITAARARDDRYREAFANEVRAVARLSHPGVVRVFDSGLVDEEAEHASSGRMVAGSPYLAMELASGSLRTSAASDWKTLRSQLLWLLDVLSHAHANGVIHRDLKPGNVLVFATSAVPDDEDGATRLRLTDFGLAHATDRAERVIKGTSGTPLFMAPEQFRGTWRDFGPWTDLYALGCMAWAMASGRAPFQGRGTSALMQAHLAHPPPDLQPQFRVPAGLQAWIWRLMQKEPGHRFQRAADAAWALRDLGAPAERTPPTARTSEPADETTLAGSAPTPIPRDRREEPPLAREEGPRRSSRPLAERRIPPLPVTWRLPLPVPSIALVGAGLGLYGLRAIPLVGRQAERDAIWEALREARETGGARACVLRGQAGAGKSRLAEWMAHRADEVGAAVVVHATHSAAGGAADGLSRMVAAALGAVGLPRDELVERIQTWLRRRGVRDEYEWRALTELVWPSAAEATVRFGAANERYALIRRLLGHLAAMQSEDGEPRPVVLWLDDVQWGGDALGLAEHLLHRAERDLPVLLLLTVRDEALAERQAEARQLERIEALSGVRRLDLAALGRAERTELVQRLLLLEGDLAAEVEERTGGNPLFAVQLVGDWVQRGVLEAGAQGFVLRAGEQAILPDDIHQLWKARIRQVLEGRPASAREALELAALLGDEVDAAEWSGACRFARRPIPDDLLPTLLDRRLAEVRPHGWAFAHGMLRESLERSAVEHGRAEALHDACAAALEIRLAVARLPGMAERLGRHLHAAGRPEQALGPLQLATDERRGMSDYTGAMRVVDLRADVLRSLGVAADDPRRGQAEVDRAALLVGLGHLDEAEQVAASVVSHLAKGWELLWPAALRQGAVATAKRGQLGRAEELLRKGERAAVEIQDEAELARCLLFLGDVTRRMGRRDEAEGYCRRALEKFELQRDRRGQADALMGLAAVALAREEHARTEAFTRQAIELFEEVGARFGVASARNTLGDALRGQGQLESAEAAYAEAEALLGALGSPDRFVPLLNLGLVLLARGRFADAGPPLRTALERMKQAGRKGMEGALHSALLPVVAHAGDWEAFAVHATAAHELLTASGFVDPDIASAAEQGAALASAAGRDAEARRALEVAREQWRTLGEPARVAAIQSRLRRR